MIEDYKRAKKTALRYFNRMLSSEENPYLPALEDLLDMNGKNTEALGTMEIPTNLFRGTVAASRARSFAGNFLPLLKEHSEFAAKWSSLCDSQISEGIREAVKCYEYKGRFYAAEGNKRVSVSKYLEVPSVLSDVVRILPEDADPLYTEFMDFYKVTGTYAFSFSTPGSYRKLAEYHGLTLKEKWPEETLSRILAGYYRFSLSFRDRLKNVLEDRTGDAYLTYLSFYPADSLLDISQGMLRNRISGILPEFFTSIRADNTKLIETPEADRKDKSIYDTLLDLLTHGRTYSEKNPLSVAFFYRGDPAESAWLNGHDQGRAYIEELYGKLLSVTTYQNYHTDAELEQKIDEAAERGADVVFTVSGEDMKETLKASLRYPKVRFYNCSLNESHRDVPTYYSKIYEVKFLLGALAAVCSKDHRIGYLADYPIYGTIAGINAFAIGAAMIDPEVKIHLKWSTVEDTHWRDEFAAEGISVISAHDITKPSWGREELGLFEAIPSKRNHKLASISFHWGKYYELILESILSGNSTADENDDYAVNYWYGISSGVIDIDLAEDLSYYSVKLISLLKDAVISGRMDPFSSEIISQEKLIQPRSAPKLSNNEIIRMDWLNDNIVGSLPKESDLSESARKMVRVSGVEKVKDL